MVVIVFKSSYLIIHTEILQCQGEMGEKYSNKIVHEFIITDADDRYMRFIVLATSLMFWEFSIIKFSLTPWMGSLFLCEQNPITANHTLGFPCSILTKSKPDVSLKENVQTVATTFPLGRWGAASPYRKRGLGPFLQEHLLILHSHQTRKRPPSWLLPSYSPQ